MKIAPEVAEQEFKRFADSMALDVDVSAMDDEDRKGFEQQKRLIVRAICHGGLVINDNGEPVYTTSRGKDPVTVCFHEPEGAVLMAMDRKGQKENVGKMYVTMGEMTKQPAKVFANMKMADLKVCMAIFTLFLA